MLNPQLVIVNGAQDGKASSDWIDPGAATWGVVEDLLAAKNVTPFQVQIAWVKQTQLGSGDFPAKAQALQVDLETIARNLKIRYPNVRLAYYSSRTRSYDYSSTGHSPEPTAFETAFAVRWLIEKQMQGDPTLNYDPNQGLVVAPHLSWGTLSVDRWLERAL